MQSLSGKKTGRSVIVNTGVDFAAVGELSLSDVLAAVNQVFMDCIDEDWARLVEQHVRGSEGTNCLKLFSSPVYLSAHAIKALRQEIGCKEVIATRIIRHIRRLPITRQEQLSRTLHSDRARLLVHSKRQTPASWRGCVDLITDALNATPGDQAILSRIVIQVKSITRWTICHPSLARRKKRATCRSFLARTLGVLVRRGLILAPALRGPLAPKSGRSLDQRADACVEGFLREISKESDENFRLPILQQLIAATTDVYGESHSRKARRLVIQFAATNTCHELGDLSEDLFKIFVAQFLSSGDPHASTMKMKVRREIKYLYTAISRSIKEQWPDWHIPYEVPTRRKKDPFKRDESFSWLNAHPDFAGWQDLATRYTKTHSAAYVASKVAPLNIWFEFLMFRLHRDLDAPMQPDAIEQPVHIFDEDGNNENTFWGYVKSLKSKIHPDKDLDPRSKTRIGLDMHKFFDWIAQRDENFRNPVEKTDFRFATKMNLGRTVRIALDSVVIETMRELLVEFERAPGDGAILGLRFPLATLFHNRPSRMFDSEEKTWTEVIWPTPSAILYQLTSVPIRSFQARWLDSGVRDELIYSAVSGSFEVNSGNVVPRRQAGVIFPVRDEATGYVFPGMRINTNKVEDPTAPQVGYTIPYISDEDLFLTCYVRDWYMRYSPEGAVPYDSPIRLYDHDGRKISEKVKDRLPTIYPLHRAIDTQMSNVAPYARVVPYAVVSRWYALLLGAVEKRLEEKHRFPRRLVEWETREDGTRVVSRALVDIHTLRATGITSLHDRGVPIDVIARFVSGHLTVLMTLYYVNRSPLRVREMLRQASFQFTQSIYDADGLPKFLSEEAAANLLSNPAFDQSRSEGVVQAAIRTNIHHLTDGGSGVCPGALCSEGGLDAKGNPMMVRGGSGSCGNCRLWRTSYLFLNGQVARLNEIAYECHVLARRIIDARKHVRKLGAQVELDPGNHRSKVLLHQHEGELKGLEEALDDKLYDYGGRYELFTKSKQQYIEVTRVADAGEPELGSSLSETSPYIHAHWLSLQAEVAPELGVSDRAIVDLENAIMRLCDINELPNFLVSLDKDARIRASNAFIEALSETDAVAKANPEFINKLFEGRVLLRAVGLHEAAHAAITGMRTSPRLVADLSAMSGGALVNG